MTQIIGPKGWGLVQRWESKCCGVVGIPLIEHKNKFKGLSLHQLKIRNHIHMFKFI